MLTARWPSISLELKRGMSIDSGNRRPHWQHLDTSYSKLFSITSEYILDSMMLLETLQTFLPELLHLQITKGMSSLS